MNVKIRRISIVIIIFLLFSLYVSKSILYWTTPKVTVSPIISGTITYQNHVIESRILSDYMEKVHTPTTLPDDLQIAWVTEGTLRPVSKGETLLKIEESSLKGHLLSAQNKYYEALVTLSSYEKSYALAKQNAAKDMERAEAALKKEAHASEKRKKQLKESYDTAYEIYNQVVTLGIYEMTSLDNKKEQCALAKEEFEKFQALYDNQCSLLSPCDGTLVSWPKKEALEHLPANATLFEILPNDAPVQLEVSVQGNVYLTKQVGSVAFVNPTNPLDILRLTVNSFDNKQGRATILLSGDGIDIVRYHDLSDYNITYESPSYAALVPNNAFVTDSTVYAVESVYSDNRKQNRIKAISVKKAPGNASYTPVTNLSSNMVLVTSWDREISDGDSVIIIDKK
jgi:hypothetical protein